MSGAPYTHGETVILHRPSTTTDRYGDQAVTGWVESGWFDGCAVWPRTSDELTEQGRQGVIVGLTVVLPDCADVGPHDRCEVGGVMFEVDGEPGRWRSPLTGWAPGVEVRLRRVDG